jgi:hypothetical protein
MTGLDAPHVTSRRKASTEKQFVMGVQNFPRGVAELPLLTTHSATKAAQITSTELRLL